MTADHPITNPGVASPQFVAKLDNALKIEKGGTDQVELHVLAEFASQCERIAELGSWHGRSAIAMLDNSIAAKIWCVDAWDLQDPRRDPEVAWLGQSERPSYETFLRNTQTYRDNRRCAVVKLFTDDAAKLFPIGFFDMVFIDADHRYEAVKSDILHWARLVRPKGILCGHDFSNPSTQKAILELLVDVQRLHSLWWVHNKPGWLRAEPGQLEAGNA